MKHVDLSETPDPNDSWATVELYRWQWGCLPNQHEPPRSLNIPLAMENMAKALQSRDTKEMPLPMNVSSVLIYAASLLKKGVHRYEQGIDAALFEVKDALPDPPTPQQDELLDRIIERLEKLKENPLLKT